MTLINFLTDSQTVMVTPVIIIKLQCVLSNINSPCTGKK